MSSKKQLTKQDLIRLVRDFLNQNGLSYQYNEKKESFEISSKINCKLGTTTLKTSFNDTGIVSYAYSSMNADNDSMDEVAKFLHMANYNLRNGNFELDYRDGEVRYKFFYNAEGMTELPEVIIRDCLFLPFYMLEKYGSGLAAIILGFSTADEAMKPFENN